MQNEVENHMVLDGKDHPACQPLPETCLIFMPLTKEQAFETIAKCAFDSEAGWELMNKYVEDYRGKAWTIINATVIEDGIFIDCERIKE